MQEEVENRTLTLVVSGTKFTGRLLKAAISKYLAHRKEKKLQKQRSRDAPVKPQGKQTVKQLIGQNQGVSNIEITDPSIKEFEKIARKYGVDYAVKKDRSSSPPKYLIFFKGRDADALTAAFTEYTGKKVRKAEKSERPSVLAKLSQFKELVKHVVVDRNKGRFDMGNFTFEEMNLMCIYNTGSRTGLIDSLREMRGELSPEETELRELTDSALTKLCAMTDEDFAQLELYPDFDQ